MRIGTIMMSIATLAIVAWLSSFSPRNESLFMQPSSAAHVNAPGVAPHAG